MTKIEDLDNKRFAAIIAANKELEEKHKDELVRLRSAAVGEKNNDQIKFCNICAANGWPHEAIYLQKVSGRILSDGSRELLGYQAMNYVTDRPHRHKHKPPETKWSTGWDLEAMLR